MAWVGMQFECNLGRAGVSKPSHRVMRSAGSKTGWNCLQGTERQASISCALGDRWAGPRNGVSGVRSLSTWDEALAAAVGVPASRQGSERPSWRLRAMGTDERA